LEASQTASGQQTHLQVPLAANQRCALRFDNEAGKGDHKHLGEIEAPYIFRNVETLQADFWAAMNKRRERK
jgi:hypothetical protein